jgi:Sodium/calcium exchanger protein
VKRSELCTFAATAAAVAVAGVSDLAELTIALRFVSAGVALALLAVLIGRSTEEIGHRLSAGATGVLQASVGNLPELFVGIFSLRAGLVDVVRASLVGSILANSLLVFGLAILVGGLRNGRQRFSREKARIGATMLLLAVSAIVIPTLVHELHAPAEAHIDALSGASAVLLLLSFGAVVFYLLSTKADLPLLDAPRRQMPEWSLERSVATLLVCGVLAAFVSEWFVAALEPMIHILGLSQAFAGFGGKRGRDPARPEEQSGLRGLGYSQQLVAGGAGAGAGPRAGLVRHRRSTSHPRPAPSARHRPAHDRADRRADRRRRREHLARRSAADRSLRHDRRQPLVGLTLDPPRCHC